MSEIRVKAEPLADFCVQVFQKLGMPEEDARITTDVLVEANLRGTDSHGVRPFNHLTNLT